MKTSSVIAKPVSAKPVITDADFQKFAEYFYRKTGIHFDDSKRYFVDKRLLERMQATGSENFRSWFTALRFETHGRELQHLVNAMTVNETYFFREAYQFDCLVNNLLDEVAGRKRPGSGCRTSPRPRRGATGRRSRSAGCGRR